jgi:hypothetical protein
MGDGTLDRFSSRTGFHKHPVLSKDLTQVLFLFYKHCSDFLSEIGPDKTLSINLSRYRPEKPVSVPVFCRQVAEGNN